MFHSNISSPIMKGASRGQWHSGHKEPGFSNPMVLTAGGGAALQRHTHLSHAGEEPISGSVLG